MKTAAPEARPGWFARNWFWFVPAIMSPFCLCGICIVSPFIMAGAAIATAVKGTEVYQDSKDIASASPAVQERLGTPIVVTDFQFQGSFQLNNGEGDADVTYPISGPNGTGKVHFVATKAKGEDWVFSEHTVSFDDGSPDVDLLKEGSGVTSSMEAVGKASPENDESGGE